MSSMGVTGISTSIGSQLLHRETTPTRAIRGWGEWNRKFANRKDFQGLCLSGDPDDLSIRGRSSLSGQTSE